MKKIAFFLTIGMLLFSLALFAQTTQGASNQQANPSYFAGGGYTGPVLGSIAIEDLLYTEANEFVIVEGYIVQQRVPGTYILANAPQDAYISVVVHLNPYFWSNLQIDARTPVLVYGIVNRSDMRIEIEATRVETQRPGM